MWITIADETNPQSPVYTWISIGTVNVNLKFDSGESINNVKIDDTQLDHPTSNALAKAEDVLKLKAKLKGVTVDENKSNFTFGDGYINNLGEITGSTTEAHAEITLTDEIKYVRFLGLVISSEASSAIKTYSYAFYDTNNEVIGVKRYDRVESVTSGNVSDKHEYVISVPDNAVKFMCSVGSKNRDNFYCYLQSGNNIIDIINGTCNELKYEDEVTRNNLNWQLYPLGTRTYIYANNNSHTFASISSFQNVWYKEVKKDELIKIECIRACDMYFSSEMPNSDVEFTSSAIQEGVTVIRCNADGYISFSSYYFSTSKNASPVYLYILVPNIDACIKHILDVSLTNSKAIDTLVGSDTYGTVVGIDNNKWGLSPSIDVSGYTYIGIKVHYVATSFGYSGRGSMFFDENYVAGENDAQCIVGEPINTTYTLNNKTKNGVAFFKVPDGAKYFRAFGYIASRVIYGLDYKENAIDPDEITEIVDDAIENFVEEEAATISPKTIFELNPDTEMLQKMVIAKKKYNRGASNPGTIIPLVFAHISDVHGQRIQYQRFVDFANHWKSKGYIDELIDTGDVVTNTYSQGLAWRNAIEGTNNILTVVGNHDTRCDDTEQAAAGLTLYDIWQYHGAVSVDPTKRTDAYNLLLAGKVDNWGVMQPDGAETNGLCYYYKDYTDQHIRLIALDVMGYNQDQQDWLEARLAEAIALTPSYHVVIIAHFTGTVMKPLVCNYTTLYPVPSSFNPVMSRYLEVTNPNAIAEAVDTFQTNGGNFIGYITGHYHRDMINVVSSYPKQLVFAVSSGGYTVTRDFKKEEGCKSYDDFQIVSINTEDKTVRLIKVGADIDYYMRKKDTVCVGYTLVKDDGTEPGSGETATKVKGIIGADGNIATNASNIATNATDIATNSDNIDTNASNIATNADDITAIKQFLTTKFPNEFPSEQTGE